LNSLHAELVRIGYEISPRKILAIPFTVPSAAAAAHQECWQLHEEANIRPCLTVAFILFLALRLQGRRDARAPPNSIALSDQSDALRVWPPLVRSCAENRPQTTLASFEVDAFTYHGIVFGLPNCVESLGRDKRCVITRRVGQAAATSCQCSSLCERRGPAAAVQRDKLHQEKTDSRPIHAGAFCGLGGHSRRCSRKLPAGSGHFFEARPRAPAVPTG